MSSSEQAAPAQVTSMWQAYEERVFYYLLRLTGQRETAEDLTQETFIRALQALRRDPDRIDEASRKAWLFRVATNLARDYFRRRRLIRWIPFLPDQHGGVTDDAAEDLAEQDLVGRALRKLPQETAATLLLKDAEGFTAWEIAEMLDEPYEAVRKRLARARERFRVEYLRQKGGFS